MECMAMDFLSKGIQTSQQGTRDVRCLDRDKHIILIVQAYRMALPSTLYALVVPFCVESISSNDNDHNTTSNITDSNNNDYNLGKYGKNTRKHRPTIWYYLGLFGHVIQ